MRHPSDLAVFKVTYWTTLNGPPEIEIAKGTTFCDALQHCRFGRAAKIRMEPIHPEGEL